MGSGSRAMGLGIYVRMRGFGFWGLGITSSGDRGLRLRETKAWALTPQAGCLRVSKQGSNKAAVRCLSIPLPGSEWSL